MYESMTPVASACDTSAACTVTGWAPTSSAILPVAGLYARHLRPFMSAAPASGFLLKIPCGGHGTENRIRIPCLASLSSSALREAL
jgi:hypothetical protein